jgi:hypothetical protein
MARSSERLDIYIPSYILGGEDDYTPYYLRLTNPDIINANQRINRGRQRGKRGHLSTGLILESIL